MNIETGWKRIGFWNSPIGLFMDRSPRLGTDASNAVEMKPD